MLYWSTNLELKTRKSRKDTSIFLSELRIELRTSLDIHFRTSVASLSLFLPLKLWKMHQLCTSGKCPKAQNLHQSFVLSQPEDVISIGLNAHTQQWVKQFLSFDQLTCGNIFLVVFQVCKISTFSRGEQLRMNSPEWPTPFFPLCLPS